MSNVFWMQCAHEFFWSPAWSQPKERHETSICKDTESRCVLKKRKRKKERQRKKKQRWLLAMETARTRPHCSWLVRRSEAWGGPGHFTAITAPTVATTLFFFFCISYLLTYIYIYIFFTPWRYHYSNCSHMNTGVVSIGYKCVFYSILGPGLGLLSQLHINVPFCGLRYWVCIFFLFA